MEKMEQMETGQTQVLDVERVKTLETWLKTNNINLTQVNGQRKYGGPPAEWLGPPPGARCEVFISRVPRDAYEDVLLPLFSSVGPLWEFRLMMNFSGQNRGFAYAKYGSAGVAYEAVRLLNGYVLQPGATLSVRRSTEKRHLGIGGLPVSVRQEDLLQVLRSLSEGVERVSLKTGFGIDGVCALVTFSSHHAASMAKKMLAEAFKKRFSLDISICWQTPEKPSPEERHQRVSRTLLPSPTKPRRPLPPPKTPNQPPRLAPDPPSTPPGFCRAVGGRPADLHLPPAAPPSSPRSPRGSPAPGPCPVLLLHSLCEVNGVGPPLYEMFYSHTGPDGFLCFSYTVGIPGVPRAFGGLVGVLPGPSPCSTMEEAKRAAAQEVLRGLYES
ncbi:dead end protein 1 isoform X2 [Centropristis striata]|uniref:dead end protein 1 isoform X2 n=1 Tax=Centropristis striata TaxID=184440 RepID=UPI0027E05474|nr:dead end protein 1 isoform X2 [Centropristis striata]